MKKLLTLLFTLFATGLFTQAAMVDVTIQVDLNAVDDLYTDGAVWVYMDAGWSEYYTMTDEDQDGIYSYTVSKESGTALTYSFSYQTGADPNSDYVTETVPADCANADGFREITVPDDATTLDVVAYGSCTDQPAGNVTITFQVDMTDETVLNDDVQVVIKDPWIWTALTDQGNGTWTGTVEVPANSTYPYTFVNGGQDYWDGEESVAAACNYGTQEAPERRVTVETQDVTLPLVAFGQCAESASDSVQVHFNVDMAGETVSGDGVWLWAYNDADYDDSHWVQMDDTDQDDVFSTSLKLPKGMALWYNFYNGTADEDVEEVVEGCRYDPAYNERYVKVEPSDMNLETVPFGGCADTAEVETVQITFSVDMSNETVINDDVQVVIKNPWIWTALTDQGDGTWEGTVEVTANSTYPYTFVNGGQDYWDGEESVPADCNFGTESAPERQVSVAANDTTLETVAFGQCGSAEAAKVQVTFRVDMLNETVSGDGMQVVIKDPWLWTAMTDAGDNIWEATVELTANTHYPYSFVNGAKDYWAGEETITGDCKDGDNNQRVAAIGENDTTLTAFVFGTCYDRTQTGLINFTAGQLHLYPNPASEHVQVESPGARLHFLQIVDMQGRVVAQHRLGGVHTVELPTQHLSSGLYHLIIRSDAGTGSARLIISHNQ